MRSDFAPMRFAASSTAVSVAASRIEFSLSTSTYPCVANVFFRRSESNASPGRTRNPRSAGVRFACSFSFNPFTSADVLTAAFTFPGRSSCVCRSSSGTNTLSGGAGLGARLNSFMPWSGGRTAATVSLSVLVTSDTSRLPTSDARGTREPFSNPSHTNPPTCTFSFSATRCDSTTPFGKLNAVRSASVMPITATRPRCSV